MSGAPAKNDQAVPAARTDRSRGTAPRRTYRGVTELRREYAQRREAIETRLRDFAAVPGTDYFSELLYCLLTPQSSAINAGRAVHALAHSDLSDCALVAAVLRRKEAYIRFHNTKARHIAEALRRFGDVAAQVRSGRTPQEIRAWLVANVKGLGWKEASHFLRNIGFRELAILDRHILKNLRHHGVIRTLPKAMSAKQYLAIEAEFARFAAAARISMDALDLLFWSRETGEILK